MSDYGVKISRPGYDVLTASDVNLVLSSQFNTLKLVKVVSFSYNASRNPSNMGSTAHGISYSPLFMAIKQNDTVGTHYESANAGYFGGGISTVFVDSTNVYYNQPEACYVLLFTNSLEE